MTGMHVAPATAAPVRIQPFLPRDLPDLVAFWNQAFAARRNFAPITAADFQARILDCPAVDPAGLFLAWEHPPAGAARLVGLAHALRPAPPRGIYAKWEPQHTLALLYVDPAFRRQGIGARLLQTAENWLYYCPVWIGSQTQAAYGTVEGPQPPFFGGTQQLGLNAQDTDLLHFLAHRGYRVHDPGALTLTLTLGARPQPPAPAWTALGLRPVAISHRAPFQGREPTGREELGFWGDNGGAPYGGWVVVDGDDLLVGHLTWYPMRQPGWAAIAGFWVAPALRGQGIGRWLLDQTLHALHHAPAPLGGFTHVEVQTHLTHHPQASALYERRGFLPAAAWVTLVKH